METGSQFPLRGFEKNRIEALIDGIFAVALLLLSFVSYVHLRYLSRHPYLATPELTPAAVKLLKHRVALFAVIPALSMIIAVYNTRLALVAYLLIVSAHFLPGRIDEHL